MCMKGGLRTGRQDSSTWYRKKGLLAQRHAPRATRGPLERDLTLALTLALNPALTGPARLLTLTPTLTLTMTLG